MTKRQIHVLSEYATWKRLFDSVFAAVGLILLAPVLLLLYLLVRCLIGEPVFFRQERLGLKDCPFVIFKFRTMVDLFDANGIPLSDGQRLTPIGRFMRKSSLDELPQLLNVLRGEMSLVGPRPLYTKYLPYYTEHERLRHSVRPGITGWAQIHGRNFLSWDQKLSLDVWYVENLSFPLDFKILLKTFSQIFKSDGVPPAPDEVEMDLDQERMKKMFSA